MVSQACWKEERRLVAVSPVAIPYTLHALQLTKNRLRLRMLGALAPSMPVMKSKTTPSW